MGGLGLGLGEGHDTGRLGMGGLGTDSARIGHRHGTKHGLGTGGLGTIGLCPNVTSTSGHGMGGLGTNWARSDCVRMSRVSTNSKLKSP
jgi:hypothetical protein